MALAYTFKYTTQEELEARVSAAVVRLILDDNNDGTADSDPIKSVIRDAESYAEGFLRGVYTLPITPVPTELKRICLDVAVAYLALRHPEALRLFDGNRMLETARQELKDLRNGVTRLNVETAPEPAANHGGHVASADAEAEVPFSAPAKFWVSGDGY